MVVGIDEEDTQASVEPSVGAKSSLCSNDTVSAKAVVCNDRNTPGEGVRKLTYVGDMLYVVEASKTYCWWLLQYETLKTD